jgi:hypothetical protein
MAKASKSTPKTPKKRSTKYSKLAAVCSKELAAKKKALVLAEKRLAKAQKTHGELLSEVARLDMLERSLKAVNEGLEPPQNVRYVYTYPQWVWTPNWYSYPYNGSYTITCGNLQGGSSLSNFQGGQYTLNTTPAVNLTTTGTNSIGATTTTSSGYGLNSTVYNCSSNLSLDSSIVDAGSSGQVLTCSNAGPTWQTVNNTVGMSDFTVDLSTGATEDAVETAAEEAVEVGHGG